MHPLRRIHYTETRDLDTTTRTHRVPVLAAGPHQPLPPRAHASPHTQAPHSVVLERRTPPPAPTGEIHTELFLDGTYFNGWCVLIASTRTHVIDWQFCNREKTASWTALIERLPAPDYAIIDGNGPLTTTITRHWPHTRIQRCLFHIRQDIHKHLTRRPVLGPNKELLALTKALSRVTDQDEAATWTAAFLEWEARHETFLKHRTYAKPGVQPPAHVTATQKWWYTHQRTRRAHRLLAKLIRKQHLFTWIDAATHGTEIARATSVLEGAFNQPIKDMLRRHWG